MDLEQYKKIEKAIAALRDDVDELKEAVSELVTEIHDSLKLTEIEIKSINRKFKELK
jgi:regulator of replication initiation timing